MVIVLLKLLKQLFEGAHVGLFSGLIVGVLEMSGKVAPSNSTEIVNEINAVAGGLIALFTLIAYFTHKTEVAKAQAANQTNTSQPSATITTTPTTPVTPATP